MLLSDCSLCIQMRLRVIHWTIQQISTEQLLHARRCARYLEYRAKQGTLFILMRERKIKKQAGK